MVNNIINCCVVDYSFRKYNVTNLYNINKIYSKFKSCMEKILDEGKRIKFICGMNEGFELLIANTILELKYKYKNLLFECALPNELQAVGWSECNRETYYNILGKCDIENFISKQQRKDNIKRRNRYMISSSKYIFVLTDNENFLLNSTYIQHNKNIIVLPTN
ncbi:DUF1273 family protein [Sedimentibacter sp. zth1]|uniref:SLOG family protein n=1 Tax=Sedimentibacter sp. zth1 TaxID=2816908 RepID=UPI001A92F21B|nr:SLOG family protein [Sedimentibacter sp. zth1]QSX04906.1 DUF1273 family protein [Sedimentibacter sp. zth1]